MDYLAEFKMLQSLDPEGKLKNPQAEIYLDVLREDQWSLLELGFVKDFCRLKGLSQESALLMITKASAIALPKLAKVMQIIKSGSELGLGANHNELPCDIELGREFKFHDVFICPVSKEISVKDNPPMLLQCGHVISKTSLSKLIRTVSNREGKFKCHTCPAQMTIANVQEIKINSEGQKRHTDGDAVTQEQMAGMFMI